MIISFGSIEVSEKFIQTVIPASTGIYILIKILDSHFHGNDKIERLDSRFHGNN